MATEFKRTCFTCGKVFHDKSGLNRHLKEQHGRERRFFRCPVNCEGVVSLRKDWVEKHIRRSHADLVNVYCGKGALLQLPSEVREQKVVSPPAEEADKVLTVPAVASLPEGSACGLPEASVCTEVSRESITLHPGQEEGKSVSDVIISLGLDMSESETESPRKRQKFTSEREVSTIPKKVTKDPIYCPPRPSGSAPVKNALIKPPQPLVNRNPPKKIPKEPVFRPRKITLQDPRQRVYGCQHGDKPALSIDVIKEDNTMSAKVDIFCTRCVTLDYLASVKKLFV